MKRHAGLVACWTENVEIKIVHMTGKQILGYLIRDQTIKYMYIQIKISEAADQARARLETSDQ